MMFAVIEVVTNQRGGDLDLLCKISNAKCNDSKLRYDSSKGLGNGTDVIDAANTDSTPLNSTKEYSDEEKLMDSLTRPVSTWEQQKVLLSRAIICSQRDNVKRQNKSYRNTNQRQNLIATSNEKNVS